MKAKVDFFLIDTVSSTKMLPALSKHHLNNYFGSKMAIFSLVIAYLVKKSKEGRIPGIYSALYHKLLISRNEFLLKYHSLIHNESDKPALAKENVTRAFLQIYSFEKEVVTKILSAGLSSKDIQGFRARNLAL